LIIYHDTSSILQVFTPVFTRLFAHHHLASILTPPYISKQKYGFRNYCSTGKASFKLISEILLVLNNKFNSWWFILWLRKTIWLCKSWYTGCVSE